ncbi:MAG: FAD/NAD(P)-binding protein [Terriglobales bacterium]
MANPEIDVLIVGGGFSGTMLAVQLLRRTASLSIAVMDRGGLPGRGLAYSSPHRFHLLNVPAGQMGAFPDEPEDFLRWAKSNHDASIKSRSFLPRAVYGQYLSSVLDRTLAEKGRDRFHWIQDEALSLQPRKNKLALQRKNLASPELLTRVVVLATGNFPPGAPRIPGLAASNSLASGLSSTLRSSLYVQFAWSAHALENLPRDGSVLLLGSGLTSIDMIMALKSKAFRGTIHVLSREGLIPSRHQPIQPWPLFWNANSPRTVRGLLRLIREQVDAAAEKGIDWRSVVDSLRPVTPQIWQSLPLSEQKRFLRHVRPYWDIHRHRLAPEIADIFSDMEAEGQIRFHTGRITRYAEHGNLAEILYQERGSNTVKRLHAHRVINCTGSETDCRRIDDSLITSLLVQGLTDPDPLFLGLHVDAHGALIDYRGRPSRSLFTIGPTRKGQLWETTAVPEIRQQAEQLAEHLVKALNTDSQDQDLLEPAV